MVARGAYPIYRAFSTCSSWTRPRLTRTNRGALWQDGGSKRRASSELEWKPWFKEASYEIRLLYSSLLWNFNKRPNPISRLVLYLFLLLPPVCGRLDEYWWWSSRLDAKPLLKIKVHSLIRLDLALHIVPRIRYLGFTLKGRRVPWLRRRTCPLASPNELWYDNQPSIVSSFFKVPPFQAHTFFVGGHREEQWLDS
jgi:hypothetical protein